MNLHQSFTEKFEVLKKQIKRQIPRMAIVRNVLGWWGLYNCVTQSSFKFQHIVQMYMLTHYNQDYREHLVLSLKQDPVAAELIRKKILINSDIQDLVHCREGSLGHTYAHFIQKNKIKPLIGVKDLKFYQDFHYIAHRLVCSHDIYHVVLKANTRVDGEGIVAGFTMAQIPSYVPPVVTTSAGLLKAATSNEHLVDFGLANIILGWLLGKSSNQLFNVNWDDMWDKPLEEVRQACKINYQHIEKNLLNLHNPGIPLELTQRPQKLTKDSKHE